MNNPRITIVTPSFNQGAYLEDTINSVLAQSYPNLEYIIIDGGSTDNSIEVIKKYEKHLSYWVSEKDRGLYDAVQKGFSRSTGEIMGWINSDDKYHYKSFFIVAEIFSSFKDVEWIQGNPTTIDETGRIVSTQVARKWCKWNFYQGDYKFIQQESTFWKRSLWERAGGKLNTSLKYAGDFELWLRFFRYAKLYSVGTALGAFRIRRKNQLSVDKISDYLAEAENELKAVLTALSPEERKQLDFIKKYKEFYNKWGFLRSRYRSSYNEILDYPPFIGYDPAIPGFRMHSKKS